jgi:hypothetical protein
MTLGGFVGTATFASDLGAFMPFLRLGEAVHIGEGTAFGLGRYRIEASGGQCPPRPSMPKGGEGEPAGGGRG